MIAEYADLDATDVAAGIRRRLFTAREVLASMQSAVAAVNPQLNAVVRLAEQPGVARGRNKGALAGVPVLLKDLGCPATGLASTFGSRLFAGVEPWRHDCAIVRRLKRAGAVIAGRTNSGELGVGLTTEPSAFGATRNPYHPEHSAGGSSGGSAAAVAARITPLAHATDGCGSIRVPAAFCGLFGFKPSRARVSFAPDMGESWAGMSVAFGVVRSVRDAALLLNVVSGSEPGDPYRTTPAPRGGFVRALEAPPPKLSIGVVTAHPGRRPLQPECAEGVLAAGRLAEALGHTVTERSLPFDLDEAARHFGVLWGAQTLTVVQARTRELGRPLDGEGLEPASWALARAAQSYSAADHLAAVRYLHRVGREFDEAFSQVDMLLTPISASPPHRLGHVSTRIDDADAYLAALLGEFPFTSPFNAAGWPAAAVPWGLSEGGLPLAVQLAARPGQDALLLRLARQFEIARPWAQRRPAVCA